ncbi:metallophosphoesterase family protein [Singulisphaera acidiphila]|uniref:Phosphoesterase n=1 Tax=Singulisphaera acidiphila (strain ATCC BAA-1392 / DSM 18658 / VKM B-2454 / MOB10) TaxID=886293 RepID=L0DCT9_SINAD|nr:metallophosphoesterase family protein [Singulisphaera acidiphila]AGA26653.1 phosphoesterase, MJ0936 family [Singulisphaera acidiphila DSM 18658]
MKLGLISDIHGDPLALELAWSHLTVMGADRIVCAGDLVGYGPYPDRVVAFLEERQVASVRGNHDRWALERGLGVPDEYGGGPPSAATLRALAALPSHLLVADLDQIGVIVHGSPRSDMEFIQRRTHPPATLRADLRALDANLLVVGHTHEPMWFRCDRGLVVNPGSVVSMPVVKKSSRTFALVDLTERSVSFHDVESGERIPLDPWPEEDPAPPSKRS